MAKFTKEKLQKEITRIKNETEGNSGLGKFLTNKDKVRKEILIELEKGSHYGFKPEYSTFEEYLTDSPNGEIGKTDNGNGEKLREEFEARKGSYYNAFGIVVTEWIYSLMSNLEEKKEPDYQKDLKKWWKNFNDIRNANNNDSAKSIYGETKTDIGGDNGDSNMKSWAKSEDGFTAFDYGITFNEAIKWMKSEVEKTPTYDLADAKKTLKKDLKKVLEDNFEGDDLTNFIDKVNNFGHDNIKWDKDDGLEGTVGKAENENDIKNCTENIFEAIARCFIDWYLEKAQKTTDLGEKGWYLKKIDDFGKKYIYYPYQRAFTNITNQEAIEDLRNEVDGTTKITKKNTPKITDYYLEDKNLEGELDLTAEPHLERVWFHHQINLITNFDLKIAALLRQKEPKGIFLKVGNRVEVKKYTPIKERMETLFPDDGTRETITSLDLTNKGLRGTLDLSDFDNLKKLIVNMDYPVGRKYASSNYITGINLPDSLTHLTLINNPNEWDIAKLYNLTNLEQLNLSGYNRENPTLWTGSLKSLETMTKLKSLNISYCPNLDGLEELPTLPNFKFEGTIYEKSLKELAEDVEAWKLLNFQNLATDLKKELGERINYSRSILTSLNKKQLTNDNLTYQIELLTAKLLTA